MPSGVDGRSAYGVLADWNDDRGFGFIARRRGWPAGHVAHVSAFPRGRRRHPRRASVTYIEVRDERSRPRASAVRLSTATDRRADHPRVLPWRSRLRRSFFTLLADLFALERDPRTRARRLRSCSAEQHFAMYGIDKSAAEHGDWRTPESTSPRPCHAGRLARRTHRATVLPTQDRQAGVPRRVLGHRDRELRGARLGGLRGAADTSLTGAGGPAELLGGAVAALVEQQRLVASPLPRSSTLPMTR